ncbi:hypothetical protein PAESOLCIP111_01053 [Paenibacillus solanacearum]|uniref:MerR family transcriptional regulator n=1 Tax=Paenibacillus solanacearum TaxID=2048548 RepID=A0A916JW61_9BACL|nr:hypothetical protein [Paenibacillus solanacearum]CAG7608348.1 hypothetical protein PAESOLCIP111_01053 [Paenibacillus solanacearum]
MQHFAELRYRGEETVGERRRMLEEHKQRIREQIAQLTVTLEVLNEKTDYYKEMERDRGEQRHDQEASVNCPRLFCVVF